jgi:hypothetical protein
VVNATSEVASSNETEPRSLVRWSGSFGRHLFRRLRERDDVASNDALERRTLAWLSVARPAYESARELESDPLRREARGLLATEMYRVALHAALVASDPRLENRPAADVWAARRKNLEELGVDANALLACGDQFVAPGSLVATATVPDLVDPTAMRLVARAALISAEGPLRRRRARLRRHAGVMALVIVVLALVGYGLHEWVTSKPDLLRHAASKTSSVYSVFDPESMAFCTDAEDGPWIEFDFGKPTRFSSMTIENRRDCCADRAVPLIVEVRSDGSEYREVIRRAQVFKVWSPTFQPVSARFVRLRVPRKTLLHLKTVMAHP